jgi:hypothetical protein
MRVENLGKVLEKLAVTDKGTLVISKESFPKRLTAKCV